MKCPNCAAKLMPVDGEMFCLQCGETVDQARGAQEDLTGPVLEETTDPLLQRAIIDMSKDPSHINFLPKAAPVAAPKHAFRSVQSILAQPHPMLAGAGGAAMPAPAGMVGSSEAQGETIE